MRASTKTATETGRRAPNGGGGTAQTTAPGVDVAEVKPSMDPAAERTRLQEMLAKIPMNREEIRSLTAERAKWDALEKADGALDGATFRRRRLILQKIRGLEIENDRLGDAEGGLLRLVPEKLLIRAEALSLATAALSGSVEAAGRAIEYALSSAESAKRERHPGAPELVKQMKERARRATALKVELVSIRANLQNKFSDLDSAFISASHETLLTMAMA